METLEIESEVETKGSQIDFDFLDTQKATQTLESAINNDWIFEETLVVVVKTLNGVPSDFEICGKKMIDWVCLATSGCKRRFIDDNDNLIESLKTHCEGFNYVAVFYCDTPLLKKSTFIEIMNYFSKNRMNVLKLSRGYVFKTEFLKTAKMLMSSAVVDFDTEDFVVVDNSEKLSLAFDVLKERILNYHKQNGVVLFGENTIFIDADVEIEQGAIIYPNNVLKGQSYIGKNAVVESGNYIYDSIICDGVFVCHSYIENSKVEKDKMVGPFSKLINQKI